MFHPIPSSGKSNVMDAISFVLGVRSPHPLRIPRIPSALSTLSSPSVLYEHLVCALRTQQLRGSQLRDLVHRKEHEDSKTNPRRYQSNYTAFT
jgi:hypothetical protein